MIFTGITSLTAVLALIFGFFYFNKRMKVYHYTENDKLNIICFNKGNNSCKIIKIIYSIDKNMFEVRNIKDNEYSIDIKTLNENKPIKIIVFDNFGRKYKIVYKSGKKHVAE